MPTIETLHESEMDQDLTLETPALSSFSETLNRCQIGGLDLVEYILKEPDTLHQVIREPRRQAVLIPKLLGIALVGFLFFGVAMSLVFASSGTWPM
ncbi:MAG: hypothetical protein KDA84_30825, partial [Planctomycetaceae bacterium]|nr:hypothetical protein [Planctomycetaceae bacterium]